MSCKMTEEEIYNEARRRVKSKSKFFGDLAAYVVINAGLFLIWYFVAGRGYPWFFWVMGVWGVFLLLDFLRTFVWNRSMGKEAIEKEADRIRKEQ